MQNPTTEIPKQKHVELQKVNSLSLNIIQDKTQNIPSNTSQLKIIQNLVDDIKSKGHKYSLISCVFLQFYKTGKDTLLKKEMNQLLEEEISKNKNKIISSHTGRSCMIDITNYRRKVKDILKKKKWFTKRINENNEIEYKMNSKIVAPILPRIISQLKSIEKNKDDLEEIVIEDETDNNDDTESKYIKLREEENEYNYNTNNEESKEIVNNEEQKTNNSLENNNENTDKIEEDSIDKKEEENIDKKEEENIDKKEEDNTDKKEEDNTDKKEEDNTDKKEENNSDKKEEDNTDKKEESYNSCKYRFICKKRIVPQIQKTEIKTNENKTLIKKKLFYVHRNIEQNNNNNNNNIKTQDRTIIDDKLESILNKGEIFLNVINNRKLDNNSSEKIISLKKSIEEKEKELELAKLNLEKMLLNEQKLKCYNNEDMKENINKIKYNYREYKNKIEILKLFGKIISKSDLDEDTKSLMFNYKSVHSKCSTVLNKILSSLSKLSKEYLNIEELLNILYSDENKDNIQNENNIKNENLNESIENIGKLFKNELNSALNNISLAWEDNMNINSETNLNSCINSNLSFSFCDNIHSNGNSNMTSENNIFIPK